MKLRKKDFLLEIHTEELPPKSLKKLSDALTANIKLGVQEAGLAFDDVTTFATPRRLAVLMKGLQRVQADQKIERRGPSWKAAYDADGNPTKALQGFAKSCGARIDQIEKIETEKGAWLIYRTIQKGKTVFQLMPKIVAKAINNLPVAKPMRWSNYEAEFARPVHSIIMLYGKEIIPGKILGFRSDRKTWGHRFHSGRPLSIRSPKSYYKTLREKGYVLPDFEERRENIRAQIIRIGKSLKAQPIIDEALLEEVTALTEWPVALVCKFPKRALALPKEVLLASMQEHQRCFAFAKKDGDLINRFVTVTNLQSTNPDEVIKGNQRVMIARLMDAEFFYKTDRMRPLISYLDNLKNVVFQAQLGSLYEKSERIKSLATTIAKTIGGNSSYAERAAMLAKTDLMTSMVGEFPELQGIMGCYYAEHDNEPGEIAQSLKEQYMPLNTEAELPQTKTGLALALADRLDALVGIFGINKQPTGTKDPFALRRAAIGVFRMLALPLSIDLEAVLEQAQSLYAGKLKNTRVVDEVLGFIFERLKNWALDNGYTPQQFAAVAANQTTDIPDFMARLNAVREFTKLPEAESLAAANKRVSNILTKHNVPVENAVINDGLLKEPAEIELAKAIQTQADKHFDHYAELLKSLATLREPIDRFFDDVMVMVDDEALRNNRLALLSKLRALFLQVADISLL